MLSLVQTIPKPLVPNKTSFHWSNLVCKNQILHLFAMTHLGLDALKICWPQRFSLTQFDSSIIPLTCGIVSKLLHWRRGEERRGSEGLLRATIQTYNKRSLLPPFSQHYGKMACCIYLASLVELKVRTSSVVCQRKKKVIRNCTSQALVTH